MYPPWGSSLPVYRSNFKVHAIVLADLVQGRDRSTMHQQNDRSAKQARHLAIWSSPAKQDVSRCCILQNLAFSTRGVDLPSNHYPGIPHPLRLLCTTYGYTSAWNVGRLMQPRNGPNHGQHDGYLINIKTLSQPFNQTGWLTNVLELALAILPQAAKTNPHLIQ